MHSYRVLKKFTYCGHAKKSKKDTPQKSWRRNNRFGEYDYSFGHRGHWKKHLKHHGARQHRTWERTALAAEKFDSLGANSYKIGNPWSWD